MLSTVYSSAVLGIKAFLVAVEVSMRLGLRKILLVGLGDAAVKESKERVTSALINAGFYIPRKTITISLAPAELRKQGAAFDLPIAIGILAAEGEISNQILKEYLIIGELSLDSSIRPIKGILPIASEANCLGFKKLILPFENAKEASYVDGIEIYPVKSLTQAVYFLKGTEEISLYPHSNMSFTFMPKSDIDMQDVKGQQYAKRALEVAVAGRHNILLIGPPGSGKTLLAQRIPTIMPPLSSEEAIETTKIHSVAGILNSNGLLTSRPFRSPHHTISYAGLTGGGQIPKPGEISLAHNGVLFLDELPEFQKNVLEVLRQPLEDGFIRISRASASITYPARFMLVAAMNACPCGFFSDPKKACKCTPNEIKRYISKISGPLLDRIDMHIFLPPVKSEELLNKMPDGEPSSVIQKRIIEATNIQLKRFSNDGIFFNSQMSNQLIEKYCSLDKECQQLLNSAMKNMGMSARAYHRILKVSRTIADLEKSSSIQERHLAEAVQYRSVEELNILSPK